MAKRRPPAYPLPRGLIWQHATFGTAVAGDPLAEWAYITPRHPEGLRTSQLPWAPADEQTEAAEFWFLSNFEPFINDGRWFGFGPDQAGFGQGPFAPPDRSAPGNFLQEEFIGVLPEEVITGLALQLHKKSELWYPIGNQIGLERELTKDDDVKTLLASRFDHLESLLTKIAEEHGRLGHNHGPPILDEPQQAAVSKAVEMAREGVAQGASGKSLTTHAYEKFRGFFKDYSSGMVRWFGAASAQGIYEIAKPHAFDLFHTFHDIIVLLARWIRMIS